MELDIVLCAQMTDTSSNYCGNIQPHDNRCFSFVKCDTIFKLFFFLNYYKFKLLTFEKNEPILMEIDIVLCFHY